MKSFVALAALLLPVVLSAQNNAVLFNAGREADLPYFWPVITTRIGTNTQVGAGWVLLSDPQLDQVFATNQAVFDAAMAAREVAHSNAVWLAEQPRQQRLAAFRSLLATNAAAVASYTNLMSQLSTAGNVASLRSVLTNVVRQVDANTRTLSALARKLEELYGQGD